MNDQAIQDSYELFTRGGYDKSIDEFKSLISSNQQALQDSYELFTRGGYNKSIEDYKVLMGLSSAPVDDLKKKEVASTASPTEGTPLVSPSQPTAPIIQGSPGLTAPLAASQASFGQPSEVAQPETAPIQKEELKKPVDLGFIKPLTDQITPDLIGHTEEFVVPKMNYEYGDLGFKFEESGATGDWMTVKSPDGKKEIEISLDPITDSKKQSEATRLKQFIEQNSAEVSNLEKIQEEYYSQGKKIKDQKEFDSVVKSASKKANTLQSDMASFVKEHSETTKEFEELSSASDEEKATADWQDRYNIFQEKKLALEEKKKNIISREGNIDSQNKALQRNLGKYIEMKSEQGTFGGALRNWLSHGLGSIGAGTEDLLINIEGSILPRHMVSNSSKEFEEEALKIAKEKNIEPPQEGESFQEWITSEGNQDIEDEVRDRWKKKTKKDIIPDVRKGLDTVLGTKDTTTEWSDLKRKNFWIGAIAGTIESAPAMALAAVPIVGTALSTAAFYAQTTDALMEEIDNDPDTKNLSENEKQKIIAPIAIGSAVLEEFGLRNVIASKGLLNGLVLKAIGKASATTTAKTFEELVRNEIKGGLAKGLLTLTAGGLAEAETGGAQQVLEFGVKQIYNEVEGKEMFKKNPKAFTAEWVKQVAIAAGQEAVGGFMLGTPNAISAAYTKKNYLNINDETFKIFSQMANDEGFKNSFVTKLKNDVNSGKVTAKQANEILNNYDSSVGLFRSVPQELNLEGQKEAMNLLVEKQRLEEQMEGKDPALVKKQKERISKINDELDNITQQKTPEYTVNDRVTSRETLIKKINALTADNIGKFNILVKNDPELETLLKEKTDAIQKPSTDESLLGSEQSQMGLQEVGEGNTQPQGPTTGTQETITTEKPQVLSTPEATATALEALPKKSRQNVTFTNEDGNQVSLNGNEKVLADLYHEAVNTPEEDRTPAQNSAIDAIDLGLGKVIEEQTAQQVSSKTQAEPAIHPEIAAHQETIGGLNSEIEDSQLKIEDLQADINSENQGTKEFTATIKEKIKKVKESKISKAAKEERIDELNQELEDFKQDQAQIIESRKDEIKGHKDDIKSNNKKIGKLNTKIQTIQQQNPQLQLETSSERSSAKQEMVDEATRLMEQQEQNGFSENEFDATNPEVTPTTITITENSELAKKVRRMGLSELVGKKINLVMADQLKVGELSIGGKILKRMGGPFFPLIDKLFGKVAWASMNKKAAMDIVRGATKSDYTVVYNMNPSAIDSNKAMADTFLERINTLDKSKQEEVFNAILDQFYPKKFGKKQSAIEKILTESKTLSDFLSNVSKLDVDTKAKIIKLILPSEKVKAGTIVGKILQKEGMTIESIRNENIEQFVADLPAGALTMVLEVQDKNGNKVTAKTLDEAIVTREEQEREGLPIHDNYPVYIRGKAVAILKETVPFWNILKGSMHNIDAKVANIITHKSGRNLTSKEAVSNEMRAASMGASKSQVVSEAENSMYKKFVSILSKSFPSVEVVTSQAEFNKLLTNLNAKKLSTKSQKVYGAVYNGKLYLNPSLENYNTPIHEFGHIWTNVVKEINTELYNKGINLVNNSEYIDKIKNSPEYKRIIDAMKKDGATQQEIDAYISEEALATAIGDKGESFVIASQKKDFKNWLNNLYTFVRKLTGISKYTPEQLQDITLSEFTQAVSVDILSGKELFAEVETKPSSNALQLSTSISETNPEGYKRVMDKVDQLIARQTKAKIATEKMAKNIDLLLRKMPEYINAKDSDKKILERDARAKVGAELGRAPSRGRILGIISNLTSISDKEKLSLITKIRSLVKDAGKDLVNELRELNKKGRITSAQAVNLISRFNKVNMLNEVSVSRFVDYMANVFNNADYANTIQIARNTLSTARKNVQTKIGVSENLSPVLMKLFTMDPSLVPTSMLEKYMELVDMFGKKQTVLTLQDKALVTKNANEIMDQIENEQSQLDELAQIFDSSKFKVLNDDGSISYSKSIDNMLKNGEIDEYFADIMRKYKTGIVGDKLSAKMTEEEIAEEKDTLLDAIDSSPIQFSAFPTQDERNLVADLKELIKVTDLARLSNLELKNLLKLIDNINNSYLPHYAFLVKTKLDSINAQEQEEEAVSKAKPLTLESFFAKIRSMFGKDYYEALFTNNAKKVFDQVLGDGKTQKLYNALFRPTSDSFARFNTDVQKIQERLRSSEEKISKSFGLNPDETTMSKYKIMTYLLQLEYQSNEGSKQVNSAAKFLEKTILHISQNTSRYREKDAQMLRSIASTEGYLNSDGEIDLDKLYASFNPAEKAAIKTIREINEQIKDKAVYTAQVIRGDKINLINNYVHLNVLHETEAADMQEGMDFINNFNESLRPSTKAKSLIERTGAVSAISFDPFTATQRGSKQVLMDYHLTGPIKTARMAMALQKKELQNSLDQSRLGVKGDKTNEKIKVSIAISNAIEKAYENSVLEVLGNAFSKSDITDSVIDFIATQGYRATLASIPRAAAELSSNLAYAFTVDPEAMVTGIKNRSLFMGEEGSEFMYNVKSAETGKVFAGQGLSGKFVDTNILKDTSGIKGSTASRNSITNKMTQIHNLTSKKLFNSVAFIADSLVSLPDKMVSRPLWFGAFFNEFERLTGEQPDRKKIAANDEAYMNKFKSEIEQAKNIADDTSVRASSTSNPFVGVAKKNIVTKPGMVGGVKSLYHMFNNFLVSFTLYEYMTARTGIMAMMGNGSVSRSKGARMIAGVTMRSMIYFTLGKYLSNQFTSLLTGGADDDKDEKSLDKKAEQSLVSALSNLLLGRNFGNLARTIVSTGLETINEKYLDFLREGDYDKYKDAIAYTPVPIFKTGKEPDYGEFLIKFAGPFTPLLATLGLGFKRAFETEKVKADAIERSERDVWQRIPFELLGELGMIPFFKDIKKAVVSDINARQPLTDEQLMQSFKKENEKNLEIKVIQQLIRNESNIKIKRELRSSLLDLTITPEEKKAQSREENAIREENRAKLQSMLGKWNSISEMRDYSPNEYEAKFGPKTTYGKEHAIELAAHSLISKALREAKDRKYNKVRQSR